MEIDISIGFVSYLSSALLFLFVLIIYLAGVSSSPVSRSFVLLIGANVAWSLLLTLSQVGSSIPFKLVMVGELLRYFTWFYVLQQTTGQYRRELSRPNRFSVLSPVSTAIVFGIALLTVLFNDNLGALIGVRIPSLWQIVWILLFSVLGLLVVEQIYRNTRDDERHKIVYLCISAGAIFVYDFFVYSNAVLVQAIDYEFWSARGVVNSLTLPTLVIAAVRNPSLAPTMHISRQFIFHSATLLGTGGYLVLMAVFGYYIKSSSGEWGKLLQASFLVGALLLLLVMFQATKLKLYLKQYLSRSFRNKYDYREEWGRFSQTLLAGSSTDSLEMRALNSIAQIISSPGARLWLKEGNRFVLKASWMLKTTPVTYQIGNEKLLRIVDSQSEPVTSDKLEHYLEEESDLAWMFDNDEFWLLLPLSVSQQCYGFVQLSKPIVGSEPDIEDRELLSTIAHHIGVSLFLKDTDTALRNAERFREMNQMTAFLLHDLKTVLSQLSLVVENADYHKDNPEFIDDMIKTVKHTVRKLQRLVEQIKDPGSGEVARSRVELVPLLESIVESYHDNAISPVLVNDENLNPMVEANASELTSAIRHIVQNAVESIEGRGKVEIRLRSLKQDQLSITIEDTGKGMSQEFIVERLFKPFDSTKGVSGMGVGVYQSREYIQSIEGELKVQSELGSGTTFDILIPMVDQT